MTKRSWLVRGADWGLKSSFALAISLFIPIWFPSHLLEVSYQYGRFEATILIFMWTVGLVVLGPLLAGLWSGDVSFWKGFLGGAAAGIFLVPLVWVTLFHRVPLTLEGVFWWLVATIGVGIALNPRLHLVIPGMLGRSD